MFTICLISLSVAGLVIATAATALAIRTARAVNLHLADAADSYDRLSELL